MNRTFEKYSLRTFYRPNGSTGVHFIFYDGDFWLDISQISILLGRPKKQVRRVIKRLFRKKFFGPGNVQRFSVQVHPEKNILLNHYNLNVISHTGYELNSFITDSFRQWALRIKFYEGRPSKNRPSASDKVPLLFSETFGLKPPLHDERLSSILDKEFNRITYREAVLALRRIKRQYSFNRFFGEEKGMAFKSALKMIYQTYEGEDLYPGAVGKGAHLLYFLLKHQAFFDGNKRIGVFMFLWFLHRHNLLFYPSGKERVDPGEVMHLVNFISGSSRKDMGKTIEVIKKFITQGSMVTVQEDVSRGT